MLRTSGAQNIAKKRFMKRAFCLSLVGALYPSKLELPAITLSLPKCCKFTPKNVHERFQTLLTPVLTIFTDFLSAVVTSEIAQILSLYGGGFLALKWQS